MTAVRLPWQLISSDEEIFKVPSSKFLSQCDAVNVIQMKPFNAKS